MNPRRSTVMRQALALAFLLFAFPAAADDADDIRARLAQWTADFNDKRADRVCDLFSKEAISDFRGQPERTYDEICALLKRSLADATRTFSYSLDLREIIVAGNLAVVRLTWSLNVAPPDVTSLEPGMDVFRKEADGQWRIIRYMAYDAE